ncbi:odorant receptor 131-2-like [Engystomops pustulosus]|uniref:odorant receptor 131-2-like n=1 Tax=Engystomops pustulosus TaxID=76066 RepID=UPI003AFA2161
MVNSTGLSNDTTFKVNMTSQILRTSVHFLMIFFFCIFMYFMVIILNVFLSSPQVRETTRHILFIHMLMNDLVYLLISYLLFIFAVNYVLVHVPVCLFITIFSSGMSRITPYNLAAMALERYAAICHPLRYGEVCTVRRSLIAITCMWILGLIPTTANVIVYCCSADPRNFYLKVICDWRSLDISNVQAVIRNFTDITSFSVVGLIIAYTYVKVMQVARRADSGKIASKAAKTVLLHGFQLFLALLNFTTFITETYLISYFQYLAYTNFFFLMSLPRFVSPLIYGLRDEVFGKSMKRFYLAAVFTPSCQKVCRSRN